MNNTKKIVVVVAVIVVVVAVIAVVWHWRSANNTNNTAATGAATSDVAVESSTSTSGAPTSSTRLAVPANAVVPNEGASSTPANVAVPVVQGVGDPAGNVAYRSFNINIQNGAYIPSTVIVNQGDTVNLELTAVDAAYGFDQPDLGFNTAIPKGKTQTIQFQALNTGNFTFYCASCGGPSKGPVGHIIVVAK
jgi:heme/copper-type cytochrome/quinol oxidase subunit 2